MWNVEHSTAQKKVLLKKVLNTDMFIIARENICYWYSLEMPCQFSSLNEYPQHILS